MRNRVGLITFLVFLVLAGAGAVAVVAISTSTGLELGGSSTSTGAAVEDEVFLVQDGWIRNNSPWPVEITAIDLDAAGATGPPDVYLLTERPAAVEPEEEQPEGEAPEGEPVEGDQPAAGPPAWAGSPVELPYALEGGGLRYFGFGLTPAPDMVASFDSLTVTFRGPLGFTFDATHDGVVAAVSSATLSPELVATDPAVDVGSLDRYIAVLRAAVQGEDLLLLRAAMGAGATEEDAAAMAASQEGYTPEMLVDASPLTDDGHSRTIQFYLEDPAVDGLPPLSLEWEDYRWMVTAW